MLESILFVPDAHHPFEDRRVWDLMMHVATAMKPKHIIVLGDFADFYAVSSHSKDPRRAGSTIFVREIEHTRKRVQELNALHADNRVFLGGNHEDRLTRYLQDKAPELAELRGIQIPELLGLKGWRYVPYKSDYRLGKLYAVHDVGYAGRFGAQRLLDTYQHCVVGGHTHRLSYIVEGNAAGDYHVAATFGWLGDFTKVDYMQRVSARKNWAHGFGVGWLDTTSGAVHVQPIPVVKYKCVFGGREYRA